MNRPAMLIDPRTKRLRLNKCAMQAIGDPKFFTLVINDKSIIVSLSEESNPDAYRVKRQSPEVHRISIVRQIYALNKCWDKNQAYYVFGVSDRISVEFNFEPYKKFSVQSRISAAFIARAYSSADK